MAELCRAVLFLIRKKMEHDVVPHLSVVLGVQGVLR